MGQFGLYLFEIKGIFSKIIDNRESNPNPVFFIPLENMETERLLNKSIKLPTHFPEPDKVERATLAGSYYKLRVRRADGYLEEADD